MSQVQIPSPRPLILGSVHRHPSTVPGPRSSRFQKRLLFRPRKIARKIPTLFGLPRTNAKAEWSPSSQHLLFGLFRTKQWECSTRSTELVLARLQMIKCPSAVARFDEIPQSTFTLTHTLCASCLRLLLHVAAIGHLDRERQCEPARGRGAHARKAADDISPLTSLGVPIPEGPDFGARSADAKLKSRYLCIHDDDFRRVGTCAPRDGALFWGAALPHKCVASDTKSHLQRM